MNLFTIILVILCLLIIFTSLFFFKNNKSSAALIIGFSLIMFALYQFINGIVVDDGWSAITGAMVSLIFGIPGIIIVSVVGYKKLHK